MTNLTTMHLKCLLEQATPGPWEAEEDVWGHVDVSDGTGHKMIWGGYCGFQSKSDPKLAAHAPQLAEEVIRLRGEIKGLITAMEVKAATGESQSPAIIAGYLKEIVLGEANE